jgi:hypothetical protein
MNPPSFPQEQVFSKLLVSRATLLPRPDAKLLKVRPYDGPAAARAEERAREMICEVLEAIRIETRALAEAYLMASERIAAGEHVRSRERRRQLVEVTGGSGERKWKGKTQPELRCHTNVPASWRVIG